MTLPTATLAQRIKTARLLIGLSQFQLAKKSDLPPRTICRWETERSSPRPSKAAIVARALGVSLRWLLTGEGPMETTPETPKAPVPAEALDSSSTQAH